MPDVVTHAHDQLTPLAPVQSMHMYLLGASIHPPKVEFGTIAEAVLAPSQRIF